MEKTNFIDKSNFDDVYIRNVIVAFLAYLNKRFYYYQNSQEKGKVKINVPVYYPLLGDNRYIMDSFYDDIPDKRVNINTDQIPRGILKLDSWNIKMDEFTNPNSWIDYVVSEDDELIQKAAQMKAIPIKLTFTLETILDNEIDIFKIWQTYMENLWMYKYFIYDFKRMPLKAVFNYVGDTDNPMSREKQFGDIRNLVVPYTFEVHTFFPVFDNENELQANSGVTYLLDIYYDGQQDVSYLGPQNNLSGSN